MSQRNVMHYITPFPVIFNYSGQVVATFTGLGTPISKIHCLSPNESASTTVLYIYHCIGIKLSDAVLAQGSEAASIAASQAMLDAHAKAANVMISRMQAMYSASGLPNMPISK